MAFLGLSVDLQYAMNLFGRLMNIPVAIWSYLMVCQTIIDTMIRHLNILFLCNHVAMII